MSLAATALESCTRCLMYGHGSGSLKNMYTTILETTIFSIQKSLHNWCVTVRDDVHICAAVHVCEITTICERTRRLKGKGQSSAPLKKLQAISQTDSLASAALDRSTYEWTTMSYARSGDDEQKLNVMLA